MSNVKKLIEGLEQLVENERSVAELYKRAADTADKKGKPETGNTMRLMQKAHADHALALDQRKDELERAEGEGAFAEMLESFEEALSSIVAGLPVDFIQGEVDPDPSTLITHEERLIGNYNKLEGNADPETNSMLQTFIGIYRSNIQSLSSL